MKLKDIVCDLKYAIKLKELGVEQTSSYAVYYNEDEDAISFREANIILCGMITNRESSDAKRIIVSAFTAEELLSIMPKDIEHNYNDFSSYYLCMGFDGEYHQPLAWYEDDDLTEHDLLICESDEKMANALAKVLIELLEKKTIKL